MLAAATNEQGERMAGRLEGKTAIVLGGARGIGEGVVAVFVRDDYGVQPRRVGPDCLNASDRLPRAEAAINQDMSASRDDQSRVARTTAGEYANAHLKKYDLLDD